VPILEAFVDAPKVKGDLAFFPILASRSPSLHYLLSCQVGGRDILTFRERGNPDAPMLLARNGSFHNLLLLAGEALPGGDRERRLNRPFLLAGNSVVQIPGSAVEAGDWSDPEVEETVTRYLEAIHPEEDQIGFLAFSGRTLLGIQALGAPNLYHVAHRFLLAPFIRECFAQGLRGQEERNGPQETFPYDLEEMKSRARGFLLALEEASRKELAQAGTGVYSILSGSLSGGELLHQGNLVHLSAHPARGDVRVGGAPSG